MTILIIADHDNQKLKATTLNTVAAAKQIGGDIHILVAGFHADNVVKEAAQVSGISKVLHADEVSLENALAENLTAQVLAVINHANQYSHILFSANAAGKSVAPRVAAKLDVAQVSDVLKIVSEDTFERPIYAGNAIAVIQCTDLVKVLTIRTTAFDAAGTTDNAALVETITATTDTGKSKFEGLELVKSERPDLLSARVVVAGGRAFDSKDSFNQHLLPIADKLNAAVGATRAAIDMGHAPNDWQIGQTGKVIAPELYIAVGISGAFQHTAGVKDSRVIVAINKDPEAPIFQVADFGIVGDLYEILPKLAQVL